jgi:perosamine synthetase
MSNLAAAVALAQLEKVDHIISLRQNVAKLYESLFSKISGIELLNLDPNNFSVYWRYQIFVDNSELLVSKLAKLGIESRTIFKPMHRHPYYDNKDIFVNAEHISSRGVDLPSGPCLTEEQIYKVVEAVNQSL